MTVLRFPVTNVPRPGWLGVCPVCTGPLAFLANDYAFCRDGHTFEVGERELIEVDIDDKTLRGW